MIEYGTGSRTTASPGGTCFYPRNGDEPDTILCDRDRHHLGRHAAYDDYDRRIYWVKKVAQ